MNGRLARLGPILLLLGCLVLRPPAAAADIVYIHDGLGRLVGVVDPAGDTAVYTYDTIGNLLSIARYSSSTVSIIDMGTGTGSVGGTVTIAGTGFSATPGQNTVTFNGTAATVLSATPTELVVTVPAGATTGAIVVTSPGGSAISAGSFTVTGSAVPAIASVTPAIGAAGTAVTISGSNFEPVPASNRLTFNSSLAAVGSATATSLGATVPVGATSGRLSVATPAGAAQSGGDFFVPPPGISAADVVFTGRMVVDASSLTGTITPANKAGLVVFDGAAGQAVSLGLTAMNIPDSDVTIFRPDGTSVLWQEVGAGMRYDLHVAALPATGTYTILLDPRYAFTGNATLTLSQDLPPVAITPTGPGAVLTVTRPAQRSPLTFTGTSGQRLSLGLTASTVSSTLLVLKPDGSTLASAPGGWSSLDLPPLPATGSYTVLVDPTNAGTGTMTVTLSEEISGSITVGGAAVPLSLARPGQRARLTFSGTAGQRLDLGLTGSSIAFATASVLNPDQSTLASLGFGAANSALDPPALPSTGTYTLLIDPSGTNTGTVTLTLSEELAGTITPGGAAVPVSLSRAGQRARLSFTGAAGQRVSVGLTGVTIPSYNLFVLKPDGTALGNSNGTAFLDPLTLPSAGTYAVLLDPAQTYTGNATVTLYDVPADVTGSLTINDPAVHVDLTVPGQQAALTFPGTTGQGLTARGASSTLGCLNFKLSYPAGGYTVINVCSAGFALGPTTLPQTGTYTLWVDPSGANVGGVDVSVTSP